jgi:hypothetical protein
MPKYCFKRKYGYLNITPYAIFLTRTGNWTEIEKLSEKSSKSQSENGWHKFRIKLFLYPSLLFFALIVLGSLTDLNFGTLWVIIATVGSSIGLVRYFSSDLGNAYKIPINKISATQVHKDYVTIYFHDLSGQATSEDIFDLEPKGLKMVENLTAGNI